MTSRHRLIWDKYIISNTGANQNYESSRNHRGKSTQVDILARDVQRYMEYHCFPDEANYLLA